MSHIGTLEGVGTLATTGRDPETVAYRIDVERHGHTKSARGTLTGGGAILVATAANGGGVLALDGGQTVTVVVLRAEPAAGRAEIRISGPVPGF